MYIHCTHAHVQQIAHVSVGQTGTLLSFSIQQREHVHIAVGLLCMRTHTERHRRPHLDSDWFQLSVFGRAVAVEVFQQLAGMQLQHYNTSGSGDLHAVQAIRVDVS